LVTVNVTVLFWLILCAPNANVAGMATTGDVGATPVPVRATFDTVPGTLLLLWVMPTVAVFAPVLLGANVTLMVQDAPAATDAQPVGVAVNIAALVPVTETLVTASGALPVLLTVMVCPPETVPVVTEPKASDGGVTAAVGASPVPVNATVEVDPARLLLS
jgi:hypothetical protein